MMLNIEKKIKKRELNIYKKIKIKLNNNKKIINNKIVI